MFFLQNFKNFSKCKSELLILFAGLGKVYGRKRRHLTVYRRCQHVTDELTAKMLSITAAKYQILSIKKVSSSYLVSVENQFA